MLLSMIIWVLLDFLGAEAKSLALWHVWVVLAVARCWIGGSQMRLRRGRR